MPQSIIIQPPACLQEHELNEFEKIVLAGGEVQAYGLRQRLQNAYRLGQIKFEEKVLAVGAIKQSNFTYRKNIFAKAKLTELASRYKFEIGWVYVQPQSRGNGLASQIVASLLDSIPNKDAYATSRATNLPMHSVLLKNEFRCAGEPYESTIADEDIIMFIRERGHSYPGR